ncbi:MAG: HNH endonuclease [Promicromonosporaceae bacterium]|nr:HNH endonuclease [Promicromonosporaceae bacterium]
MDELRREEAEEHGHTLAALPAELLRLLDVRGQGFDGLGRTLEVLRQIGQRRNQLDALEALWIERARRQALRSPELLNTKYNGCAGVPHLPPEELEQRAAIIEISLATKQTEGSVARKMSRAQILVERAPRVFKSALAGDVCWRNASKVAQYVEEMTEASARMFDSACLITAGTQNPAKFAYTAKRKRDQYNPAPPELVAEESVARRRLDFELVSDGMAWLSIFGPAPTLDAVYQRVNHIARAARCPEAGDTRTLEQARVDVLCALALDDGELDIPLATQAHLAQLDGELRDDRRQKRRRMPSVHHPSPPPPHAPPAAAIPVTEPSEERTTRQDGAALPPVREWDSAHHIAQLGRSVSLRAFITVPVMTLLDQTRPGEASALLNGVVPVDPETAKELCGLATSFTRLLTDPLTGNVLAVDPHTYRPGADLAQYVTLRDQTCRFPGCTRRAAGSEGQGLDLDHTLPFGAGGPTQAHNLALLCRKHHTAKHRLNYAVSQSDGTDGGVPGALTWITPTGRSVTTHPDPLPATIHSRRLSPVAAPEAGRPEAGPDASTP